jgi:hypothetical protein
MTRAVFYALKTAKMTSGLYKGLKGCCPRFYYRASEQRAGSPDTANHFEQLSTMQNHSKITLDRQCML